jgi:methylmalonyl-CoA mutase
MTEKQAINELFASLSEFNVPSYEEWEKVAAASLKGKPLDKLFTMTYEGIQLKPVYTKEDIQSVLPTEIRESLDNENPWEICQPVTGTTVEEMIQSVQYLVENGVTSLLLANKVIKTKEDLHKLLEVIPFNKVSLRISTLRPNLKFEAISSYKNVKEVHGVVGLDPISQWLLNCSLEKPLDQNFDEMATNAKWAIQHAPSMKTILIQSQPFHDGGANAVQEIGYTLSVAIEYLNQLIKRGMTINEIASQLTFSFSVGSNLFMEISKLRAVKFLWAAIVKEYGGNVEAQKAWIHARTSYTTKTVYDPYVNILRSTVETFAAVIAGVNSITTSTFDEPYYRSTAFSERIARNIQSILKDETHLNKVLDPAGGSWYVENLTEQLSKSAWTLLQEVEKKGGIIPLIRSYSVQKDIEESRDKRWEKISFRKEKIVGTNMYANPYEEFTQIINPDPFLDVEEMHDIVLPIAPMRWSLKFEFIRDEVNSFHKKTGQKLSVHLVNIGNYVKHKPRTDFIKGFFEVGGFEVLQSPSFQSIEEMNKELNGSNPKVIIICGDDNTYLDSGIPFVQALRTIYPASKIYLAGKLEPITLESYQKVGLTNCIHMNTNCYEFLTTLQKEMVGYYEKA